MLENSERRTVDLAGTGPSTRAVHAGTLRGPDIQPVVPPIYPSVSYMAENPDDLRAVLAGEKEGYVYSRNGNPTVAALRESIAALEGRATPSCSRAGWRRSTRHCSRSGYRQARRSSRPVTCTA